MKYSAVRRQKGGAHEIGPLQDIPTSSQKLDDCTNNKNNVSPPSHPWPEDNIDNDRQLQPSSSSSSSSALLQHLQRTIQSTYNKWTYGYMNRIFAKGAKQKRDKSIQARLAQSDLFLIPRNNDAAVLNAQFWNLYQEQTTLHHNHFLLRTLWLLVKPTFVPAGVCQLIALGAQLSIPMCVMKLLQEVEGAASLSTELVGSSTSNILYGAIPYVLLIFLLSIINALCSHRHQFLSYQSGIIIRSAVSCAIYEKALKLSPTGREGLTSGEVTNLVATDTQKLFEVMHEGHMIWSCPLAILVVVTLLFILIGPSCLVGAAILIGLVPLSKKVAHIIVQIRKKRVAVADERVHIVAGMLQNIKVTKLNNYEDQFERRVMDARKREMELVRKEQFVWGFTLVIRVFTPVLASFATFATYVLVSEDNIMTASMVFTLAMLFQMLKFPINQAGQLLSKAALGVQAMHRISKFMGRDTKKPNADADSHHDNIVMEVKNGTFFVGGSGPSQSLHSSTADWDGDIDGSPNGGSSFALSNINFSVARGEVLAVVGSVASGKSTLIQGLLGDVGSHEGTTISMTSGCNVSFAAQTPFILSTTVRENILFGSSYDKERYEKVLDACCLRQDLLQWAAGDLTEIGERGVTMSGGQKQRVSVARAVYANPDLGLFDDILSALDAGTSQCLFDNLFANVHDANSLLHNSGIVLVTHAVHILGRVNKILVLSGGECIFFGSFKELQTFESSNPVHLAKLESMRSSLQTSPDENAGMPAATSFMGPSSNEADAHKGELTTPEEREHGVSSLGIWWLWFEYAGGLVFIVIQICLMACDRGSYVAIDWWLATWTSSAGKEITVFGRVFPDQFDGLSAQVPYVIVYTAIVFVMLFFLTLRSQWAVFGGIRACDRVFSTMTHRVLHAPMWYFDVTPLGRILNRFTYDVEQVDITLSQFMSIFIIACSWLVAGQVVMIALVPYMAIINAFVLLLYVLVLRHYQWSAADLQRLDAVSRSPIQASLAEGLDGSNTIRAYHKNDHFAGVFRGYINDNSSAMLNFVASRRWLAVRLETLGAFVTLAAGLSLCIFNEQLGLSPGLSGLLLVWANSFTVTLGFLINAFSEAEAGTISIERMHSMEMLPQEKSMITSDECKVDNSWPRHGSLEFKDVSLRYRPGLPLSLDGLSFKLQHGQRCAVVGRTGAGKSSLTVALFRLADIESGSITLDGVDLSTLGLSDVRGRRNGMFILPQDPSIFSGTIRSNLDPFASHDDDGIVKALELIEFPGIKRGMQMLEDSVEEGGANFSAGEKQLLCLARAMLANPRLLVLDEATSAVDGTTDEFVQQMLRSQFPDTTLLTIAHRLNTIIDYDTVIVMDRGRVAEFGSPRKLLKDETGIFTGLVNATGPESASQLKMLAK
ncbi:hypothetical protein ACHAXR_012333 [Thalassiosira sp. AJA248-18]